MSYNNIDTETCERCKFWEAPESDIVSVHYGYCWVYPKPELKFKNERCLNFEFKMLNEG